MSKKKYSTRTKRDYEKLKHTAYELVVKKNMEQKEAAAIVGVSEQTMSSWANDGKWKEEKEARQLSSNASINNVRELLGLLAKHRLELEKEIFTAVSQGDKEEEEKLRKRAISISDEMSKINKTLEGLEKDSKYTLGEFIDVMDDIFAALRAYDDELWENTIPFQQQLVHKKTIELG